MTTLPGEPVDLPLPPALTETFGHRADSRFVGFTWSGGHLMGTTGVAFAPAQTWAFILYSQHPAVGPLLAPFDLGTSEKDGKHVLVIDREANRASVATVYEAMEFLREQWPSLTEVQREAQQRGNDRVLEETPTQTVDADAIRKHIAEQKARVGRMLSWLDQCPTPERGQTP